MTEISNNLLRCPPASGHPCGNRAPRYASCCTQAGMKSFASLFVWIGMGCLVSSFVSDPASGVGLGDSEDAVVAEFGDPEMSFLRNGDRILYYFTDEIVLRDGKVAQMPPGLADKISETRLARKEAARNRVWVEAERSRRPPKAAVSPPRRAPVRPAPVPRGNPSIRIVSNRGAEVNLATYLESGKVTIVDFYADWCGPCRAIAPGLVEFASKDNRVNLVKIDIDRWGSPVTRQHRIRSVPSVRVYDGRGRQIGKTTHQFGDIVRNVDRAR